MIQTAMAVTWKMGLEWGGGTNREGWIRDISDGKSELDDGLDKKGKRTSRMIFLFLTWKSRWLLWI